MARLPVPGSATTPLPGGSDGAEVEVLPLECGRMPCPPGWLHRPDGPLSPVRAMAPILTRRGMLSIPIPAFLVRHPTAGVIVVDSGLHASTVDDPAQSFGRAGRMLYRVSSTRDMCLPRQLAAHGVDVADVALVVMTHLHYDHTSGLAHLAPGTRAVVDAAEWRAFAGGGFTEGYMHHHVDGRLAWELLDVQGGGLHGAFAHTLDLFGDGSVRLLSTPGHTAGHCSLLLRGTGGRRVLLCGDASYSAASLAAGWVPLFLDDQDAFEASRAALRADLAEHPQTLVAHGHDPDVWPPFDAVR